MYGFIPLIGSDFLARVMPKFFNNVPKLVSIVAGVFGAHLDVADVNILPNDWLVRLQYATVFLGIVAASYTMSRITGKDLGNMAAHKTLSRVIPALMVVVVGIGIIALYAMIQGAE
jgi:hypothetical protein